jgi:hypothetical protein
MIPNDQISDVILFFQIVAIYVLLTIGIHYLSTRISAILHNLRYPMDWIDWILIPAAIIYLMFFGLPIGI